MSVRPTFRALKDLGLSPSSFKHTSLSDVTCHVVLTTARDEVTAHDRGERQLDRLVAHQGFHKFEARTRESWRAVLWFDETHDVWWVCLAGKRRQGDGNDVYARAERTARATLLPKRCDLDRLAVDLELEVERRAARCANELRQRAFDSGGVEVADSLFDTPVGLSLCPYGTDGATATVRVATPALAAHDLHDDILTALFPGVPREDWQPVALKDQRVTWETTQYLTDLCVKAVPTP